jgi:hypothetical protein
MFGIEVGRDRLTRPLGRPHGFPLHNRHGPTGDQVVPRIHAAGQLGSDLPLAHVPHLLVARLCRRKMPRPAAGRPKLLRHEAHRPSIHHHWIVCVLPCIFIWELTGKSSSFLLFNTILEALMWASHRRNRQHGTGDPEKDRPLTATTGTTTATTGATNGDRLAPPAQPVL